MHILLFQPVEDTCRKEYESFRSSFTLSSQAVEIGSILDEEPDVARYYAELVPATMVPEEFWGRWVCDVHVLCVVSSLMLYVSQIFLQTEADAARGGEPSRRLR